MTVVAWQAIFHLQNDMFSCKTISNNSGPPDRVAETAREKAIDHEISRCTFCIGLGASTLLLGKNTLGAALKPRNRPNIVYILADHLGWGDMDDGPAGRNHRIPSQRTNGSQVARRGLRATGDFPHAVE